MLSTIAIFSRIVLTRRAKHDYSLSCYTLRTELTRRAKRANSPLVDVMVEIQSYYREVLSHARSLLSKGAYQVENSERWMEKLDADKTALEAAG